MWRHSCQGLQGWDGDSDTHVCGCAGSRTFRTLSTAMGDSSEEYCDTTLLLRDLHSTAQHSAVQCSAGGQPRQKNGGHTVDAIVGFDITIATVHRDILSATIHHNGAHVLEACSSASRSSRLTGMEMLFNICAEGLPSQCMVSLGSGLRAQRVASAPPRLGSQPN